MSTNSAWCIPVKEYIVRCASQLILSFMLFSTWLELPWIATNCTRSKQRELQWHWLVSSKRLCVFSGREERVVFPLPHCQGQSCSLQSRAITKTLNNLPHHFLFHIQSNVTAAGRIPRSGSGHFSAERCEETWRSVSATLANVLHTTWQ